MSDIYDSTRDAWEDIWQGASVKVELQAIDYPRAREVMDTYTRYLPDNGPVLEAGCGLSAALIRLQERGYNVIGLDYAVQALQTSREYDPTLRLQAGDVHALPYADDSIAAYLSFGVLEHFEHGMAPALKEAARVVRPGGILVLTIPYPNIIWRFSQFLRRLRGMGPLIQEGFYESRYTRRQLEDAVTVAGFEVVAAIPTAHSFTLWGLGGPFRTDGYYQSSALGEWLGRILKRIAPWPFNFSTMIIGRRK